MLSTFSAKILYNSANYLPIQRELEKTQRYSYLHTCLKSFFDSRSYLMSHDIPGGASTCSFLNVVELFVHVPKSCSQSIAS